MGVRDIERGIEMGRERRWQEIERGGDRDGGERKREE